MDKYTLAGVAHERLVAEQQLAERATAERFQIQATTLQGAACGHAAGEYPRLAVAAQVHLAHPALRAWLKVQGLAFIITQGLPALEQRGDAEVIVGQGGQTAGQRTLVEEPVEGRLVDVGSQL